MCFCTAHPREHHSRPHGFGLLQESMKVLKHLAEEGKQAKNRATPKAIWLWLHPSFQECTLFSLHAIPRRTPWVNPLGAFLRDGTPLSPNAFQHQHQQQLFWTRKATKAWKNCDPILAHLASDVGTCWNNMERYWKVMENMKNITWDIHANNCVWETSADLVRKPDQTSGPSVYRKVWTDAFSTFRFSNGNLKRPIPQGL